MQFTARGESFVDIVVDISQEQTIGRVSNQDGQRLRSRGGHVWPPHLEGPDRFVDTMDVAGPSGPAWMRRCRSRRWLKWCLSPQMGVDIRSATGPHSQCNCVTPFVDILREGLRGADILRVGVTG